MRILTILAVVCMTIALIGSAITWNFGIPWSIWRAAGLTLWGVDLLIWYFTRYRRSTN